MATFISLLEGNSKFTQGYICSTADSTSRNLDKGITSFSEFMPDVKSTFDGVKDNFELAILDAKTAAKNAG